MNSLPQYLIVTAALLIATQLGSCNAAPPSVTAPPTVRSPSSSVATAASPILTSGSYQTIFIEAPALRDNQIGERDKRAIGVYLPPSYATSDARYPVVYYLPGYTDSQMLGFRLPTDADMLIQSGAIKEMIIVAANGVNQVGGSFYVNSPVTGRWEDFITNDVVTYVDTHYRTVAQAQARAISGHSMGGFGALHIGMRHPDTFSVIYSLSPGLFDPTGLAESQMFDSEGVIKRFLAYEERLAALSPQEAQRSMLYSPDDFSLAYGLAFAPNPAKHPPYLDYPYRLADGALVRDDAVWKKWENGFGGIPAEIQEYRDNLLRLNGLVIDYGRQDQYEWIPKGCVYLGSQLSAAGIPHELRSYDGGHESRLRERIGSAMLPFLSERLAVR